MALFKWKNYTDLPSCLDTQTSLIFHKKITITSSVIHYRNKKGKTTIAKAVYNKIVDNFEGSCFLENVGEHSRTIDGTIQYKRKFILRSYKTNV